MPRNLPKLRTLIAYAASAIGAKLSFAFSVLTNNGVIRQFSTSLFHASRSCFAPIINTWISPPWPGNLFSMPSVYGGGVGYCPQVLYVFQSVSSNCIIFIPYSARFVKYFLKFYSTKSQFYFIINI